MEIESNQTPKSLFGKHICYLLLNNLRTQKFLLTYYVIPDSLVLNQNDVNIFDKI
jgi:hypothetical protein